ncbi:IS110 family transposase, partial [bacterium]|nr:IS110 family transposase [bacterium]
MSRNDYTKQAEKRQRIKKMTLVVGVDIGKEFNAVGLMNKEGEVLGRYPKVYNSRTGFEYFVRVIEEAKAKYGMQEVLIGLEPTGHYWRKLAYFSMRRGYEVKFIRTTALKHQRELDESSSAKNDKKDAITVANITREGKYIDTVIESGLVRQLRTLSKVRERLIKHNVRAKNTLHAALDDYFPELRKIFKTMYSRGLWAVLEKCPFPEDVLRMRLSTLEKQIGKASRLKKAKAVQKATALKKAASESIGLKDIGEADKYRIKLCLDEVKRTERMVKEIKKELTGLLDQIPYSELLLSIPGVGPLSVAVFLGELGSPDNFHNARQIVKYAGYDPMENDSGFRLGRRFISKKGRWLMRKFLFFMSMQVIVRSEWFKAYY